MKNIILILAFLLGIELLNSQTNPAITNWLINTTNIKGRHYVKGNSTPIQDNILANVQKVQYSATSVYVSTHGIPAYITGPFQDGNPSLATDQNAIFKIPLNPVKNTGTPTNTTGGNIGIFINGVALFDYRDGVSWQNSSNSLKGGPLMGVGDGVWNRDAIVGERIGFDCSKAHPAMGNYHHHQNPSAFSLDLKKISSVCDLYAADGLYAIDSTKHSPLIGYAYDGFPIYGAYAFKNIDGTGGITRMKSSFTLRSITVRNQYYTGQTVTAGPPVNATYPIGYFREDYQYNTTSPATPDYLDDHNGRFCITPEYPNGIYCYFATVDENWNSAYPYVVGPTFYGVKTAAKVTSIGETVTTYTAKTNTLAVSTNSISATANQSTNKNFDITSNTKWTAKSDNSWVVLSIDSGTGNAKIYLTISANNDPTVRTATITISANGVTSQIVTLNQEGIGMSMKVSSNTLSIGAANNSEASFVITTNTTWYVSNNQQWLSYYNKVTGNGSATVTIVANANNSITPRIDTIFVTGLGVPPLKVIVTQDGSGPTLSVSASNLKISAKANSTKTFDISSNSKWNISLDQNWLSANNNSGNGNATISLTAQENSSTVTRNCNVIVSVIGLSSKTITITQDASLPSDVETENKNSLSISLFPNPSNDLIAIQSNNIIDENVVIELFDASGKFIKRADLFQGSTITYFDTKTLYSGEYIIKLTKGSEIISKRVILSK